MKISIGTFLLLIMKVLPAVSSEGFVFEPSVGYSAGVLSQESVADMSAQSAVVDGRLGYSMGSFTFGLSYFAGFGSGEQMGNKGDLQSTDPGLYLEYYLPWSVTLFGSYLPASSLKIQSTESPEKFSGQGFRFGIGWTGWSMSSVMLESTSRTYTKYGGVSLTNSIKESSTGLSISFPFR